jgi:flotillin
MSAGMVVIAVLIIAATVFIFTIVASMFRKVGPNQALIIYGFGGTHIVQGGGRVIFPMVQSARELSLELMSFDVAPTQDLYTAQGVAVNVEAVAQIKVRSDPESIRTAAEQFLTKDQMEREALIRLVMEGHLRGIVGQLTVEQIVKEPEGVGDKVRSTCAEDLNKMGLEVISFTIREVRDQNEYIANMGKPDIARIKREADIAAAEAARDTAIRRAEAERASAVARALADQETRIAETASLTKQAEAERDLEIKRAEYTATVKSQQATADKAYDIQTNKMQQQLLAEEVRAERIQREEQIKVQEAEIKRRELELIATIQKPAEAERQRMEQIAEAERQRRILEADGQAQAIRAQGAAEADVVRQKGEAEAEAMQKKADAYAQYTQAAVLDKMLTGLPELAKAMASSLNNVDRITIISDGHNGGAGSQITGEVARMVAQVPALMETITGMSVPELLQRLQEIQSGGGATGANGARRVTPPAENGGTR